MSLLRGGLFVAVVLVNAFSAPQVSAQVEPAQRSRRYDLDPVTDTVLISSTLSLAIGMELIISSGGLGSVEPGPTASLLGIDRPFAERDKPAASAATLSNVGLGLLVGYETFRVFRIGLDEDFDASLTETLLVLESVSIAFALTNVMKLAVRRPRPSAYRSARSGGESDTNDSLSFFSGHAAIAAAMAASATYLVWDRAPGSVEAWLTTAGVLLLAGGVSVTRVLALRHFPTDVAAGSLVGAAIGVLVPHLHATEGDSVSLALDSDGSSFVGLRFGGSL